MCGLATLLLLLTEAFTLADAQIPCVQSSPSSCSLVPYQVLASLKMSILGQSRQVARAVAPELSSRPLRGQGGGSGGPLPRP